MSENTGEDILRTGIDNMTISLIPSRIRVIVIGGGNAGLLKARSLSERGCQVTVVSLDFRDGFNELRREFSTELILDSYGIEHILDSHLVVIAVDNLDLNQKIIGDCDAHNKLYLNCSDYREGIFGVPYQSQTEGFHFSLQTKTINPTLSVYLGEKIREFLRKYDDFAMFIGRVRSWEAQGVNRLDLMRYMCSDEFLDFFRRGKGEMMLKMFFGGNDIEIEDSDEKK